MTKITDEMVKALVDEVDQHFGPKCPSEVASLALELAYNGTPDAVCKELARAKSEVLHLLAIKARMEKEHSRLLWEMQDFKWKARLHRRRMLVEENIRRARTDKRISDALKVLGAKEHLEVQDRVDRLEARREAARKG